MEPDVASRFADGPAVVARFDLRQRLDILGHELRKTAHDGRPFPACHLAPRTFERLPRRGNGAINILKAAKGDLAPAPAGRGIDAPPQSTVDRPDPLPSDKETVERKVGWHRCSYF